MIGATDFVLEYVVFHPHQTEIQWCLGQKNILIFLKKMGSAGPKNEDHCSFLSCWKTRTRNPVSDSCITGTGSNP